MRELARRGVTLNAVCPDPTDTPLFDNFRAASPSIGDALAHDSVAPAGIT